MKLRDHRIKDFLTVNAKKPKGLLGKVMIKSMNRHHLDMTLWGIEHIAISDADDILDIGCGGGEALRRMNMLNPEGRSFGVDISPTSLKAAKKNNSLAVKSGKMAFIRAGVSALPFEDDQLDLVTGFETFYFWPHPKEDLEEVMRVLKPGGRLAIVLEARGDQEDKTNLDHYIELMDMNVPASEELETILKEVGFLNVKTDVKGEWQCAIAEKQQ